MSESACFFRLVLWCRFHSEKHEHQSYINSPENISITTSESKKFIADKGNKEFITKFFHSFHLCCSIDAKNVSKSTFTGKDAFVRLFVCSSVCMLVSVCLFVCSFVF